MPSILKESNVADDRRDWLPVTAEQPCRVCGKADWCRVSPDGNVSACHRETGQADKVVHYGNGHEVGLYFQSRPLPQNESSGLERKSSPTSTLAGPEVLDRVYRCLLELPLLALTPEDRAGLKKRGLNDFQIDQGLYRSCSRKSVSFENAAAELRSHLKSVPGFRCDNHGWSFVCAPGILIPVFNQRGQIVAIKVRLSQPTQTAKYVYATSAKNGGCGPGSPVHFPTPVTSALPVVRVTEGELKAAVATCLSGVPTVSAPGVYGWRGVLEVFREIKPETVRVAYDMDLYQNASVAQQLDKFLTALRDAGYQAELERWDPQLGKGIDDVLAAGFADQVRVLRHEQVDVEVQSLFDSLGLKRSSSKTSSPCSSELVDVLVTNEEGTVADKVIEQLEKDASLFLRAGSLVRIVADDSTADLNVQNFKPATRIREYPTAALRELITRYVNLQKVADGNRLVKIHVPQWLVPAIIARTDLPFRRLEAVVEFPVLLADGSILVKPGYDPPSRLFMTTEVQVVVPDFPTRLDAVAAAETLLELVSDFPFQKPEHQAAWLSLVLTLLARYAFAGPSPLFLIDANVRGSGKTLLAELASLMVLGRSLSRMTNPESDEEFRKRITALVMQGESLVLIDNIVGTFGCGSLDAALTGSRWQDRILGKSETVEFPLNITWVGSGNNVQTVADTSRRICPIRLQSQEEKPESRSGFKFPNIVQHTLDHRSRYVSAGLTILKAYAMAGRPDVGVSTWGSFEGWSRVVRDALVWCGQADPAGAREEFVTFSDREAGAYRQLIAGWEEIDSNGEGLTAAELLRELEIHPDRYTKLRNAFAELCGGKLNTRSVGNRMAHLRGRVVDGKTIDCLPDRSGSKRWQVILKKTAGSEGSEGSYLTPSQNSNQISLSGLQTHIPELVVGAGEDPSDPADPADPVEQDRSPISGSHAMTYEEGEI